jgi:hypothetical protein
MPISAKRMAILREHVRAESVHDMDALIGGMTQDCFSDRRGRAGTVRWAGADSGTLSQALGRLPRLRGASSPHPVRRRIVCRHGERVARHSSRHVPGVAADRETGANARDRRLPGRHHSGTASSRLNSRSWFSYAFRVAEVVNVVVGDLIERLGEHQTIAGQGEGWPILAPVPIGPSPSLVAPSRSANRTPNSCRFP